MKSLTQIPDLSREDVERVLAKAFLYKSKFDLGVRKENVLDGKTVAMVFEKPSLRTKVAFEVATTYLGGTPVYLSSAQILASGSNVFGRESIPDIARNLERFSDLILARVYSHDTIRSIVDHVSKPVINALCDLHHPTQALADLMTLRWHKPGRQDLVVAYVGDGNNVATSLMQACALTGIEFRYSSPEGYRLSDELVAAAGAVYYDDPRDAVKGADAVYTDTFVSMGQEAEREERERVFAPYKVTRPLFELAHADAIFMHCLPAHRGEEVTSDVMDHSRSVIFDQAECRMHIAKALLDCYCAALVQTA